MLVDTSSTHNFMSIGIAQSLGIQSKVVESFKVAVANGERIRSEVHCFGVQVVYGRKPPTLLSYVLGTSEVVAVE
jgi:hypothetical protein